MTTRRTGDYDSPSLQYKSTEPDQRVINIDDATRGYIMLPIWVADKIELAGHSLSDFFSEGSWFRSLPLMPGKVNDGAIYTGHADPVDYVEEARKQSAKMLEILSFEDLADIGFMHYLLFAAFHKMNPLCGLSTEVEGRMLEGRRNHAQRNRGNDCHWMTYFGAVDIRSRDDAYSENYLATSPTCDFEFDILQGKFYGTPEYGSSISYWPMKGKTHEDIINYAVDRFYAIATSESASTRIRRTGDLVSFANVGNSTVIIPSLATVLNVATLLAQEPGHRHDDTGIEHRVSPGGIDATKEQMVVLVEEILSELKRHGDNQYLAREGLILLYTRLL